MFWSDSTHLASFGNASLWPLYTLWGNQSKYTRARPTANACNHQAYIPSMLTHLKHELMHAVWGLLLMPEYIDTYTHGIIIKCFDGIERRIFPHILTYSADYPEKILLATIKYLGGCPCPRCLVKKADIPNLGLQEDMKTRERSGRRDSPWLQRKIDTVRIWIFSKGRLVAGSAVDKVLKAESLVPTRNTFSRLRTCGFNFYSMFVPDLLHEFELGVWKAVFTHCVRILHVTGGETVSILNERFRKVPTFGRTTIQRFHNNAATMKKLAGRDFEDLLQNLTQSTKQLGQHLRKFRDQLCPGYSTKELPREKDARVRRMAAKSNGAQRNLEASNPVPSSDTSPVPKLFNLVTYKLHALGDYGELAHRRVKRFYARTNKNKYTCQVAKLERWHWLMRAIRRLLNGDVAFTQTSNEHAQPLPINIPERLPPISPQAHHQISEERRTWKNIYKFISEHEGDPAVHNFVPRLKQHLLARLRGLDYDGDEQQFTSDELNKVIIINDHSLNPRTHPDFITPSLTEPTDSNIHPDHDPYWYGRIIAIFHVEVIHQEHNTVNVVNSSQRLEVLWVRWFGADSNYRSGWSRRWLHHIGFIPEDDECGWADAFGFLNPSEVIRGVHLIPAFHFGQTDELLPYDSVARHPQQESKDWIYHYVNMFVDRDMVMRYLLK
ncbi:hypothetical protein PLEOSDRAFT_1075744 [Pleurotus ostreatus PC15]|uniref:Uncharacterized protein n=1 Tax=Pleurotus ostreatus (strain PC15) TaxID=1137138 RepID=A0A067NXJ7_PLEO1|nr:hypothetical protein PLEOSDRAFT_1075744 [Pleurotus ostreatus PC15]